MIVVFVVGIEVDCVVLWDYGFHLLEFETERVGILDIMIGQCVKKGFGSGCWLYSITNYLLELEKEMR